MAGSSSRAGPSWHTSSKPRVTKGCARRSSARSDRRETEGMANVIHQERERRGGALHGARFLREGDEILLTVVEHHSNLVPWQFAATATGATLRFIPLAEDGTLDLSTLESLLTERTKLVAVTGMSNVLGTIPPVRRLADAAH